MINTNEKENTHTETILATQQNETTDPLFTDDFTLESLLEKRRLYEKFRHKGEDIYELKILTLVNPTSDNNEWRNYLLAFAQYADAVKFVETLQAQHEQHTSKAKKGGDSHFNGNLPVIPGIIDVRPSYAEIFEVSPTCRYLNYRDSLERILSTPVCCETGLSWTHAEDELMRGAVS